MKHGYIPKFHVRSYIGLSTYWLSMGCFVAFLRGINVGGHIVVKATLEKAFVNMGLRVIGVYKQSGNVVFETPDTQTDELAANIQSNLKATLGYDVAVFLRTISQLKAIITLDPFAGKKAEGTSCLVTFLAFEPKALPFQLPVTIPKSTAEIIAVSGAELFSVTHGGGEGALPNPFVEKALKSSATTRNIHIIEEIVEKFG